MRPHCMLLLGNNLVQSLDKSCGQNGKFGPLVSNCVPAGNDIERLPLKFSNGAFLGDHTRRSERLWSRIMRQARNPPRRNTLAKC